MDPLAAAWEAGVSRLRPVLMTAAAMVIGMFPMALALGEGGEQNAPLGRAVIGGLVLATLATLFFVPVVFSLLRRPARERQPAAHLELGTRARPCKIGIRQVYDLLKPNPSLPGRRRAPRLPPRTPAARAGARLRQAAVVATLLIVAGAMAGLWPRWRRRDLLASETRDLAIQTVSVVCPAPGPRRRACYCPRRSSRWWIPPSTLAPAAI